MTTHGGDQASNIWIWRFGRCSRALFWVAGTPLTHVKTCLKFWGLPGNMFDMNGDSCLKFWGLPGNMFDMNGNPKPQTCWKFWQSLGFWSPISCFRIFNECWYMTNAPSHRKITNSIIINSHYDAMHTHTHTYTHTHTHARIRTHTHTHIWMSHVTCMSESLSEHMWVRHVTRMNESCHTHQSEHRRTPFYHIWMSHVTHVIWVMSHIFVKYVTRMNESCHTMSHTSVRTPTYAVLSSVSKGDVHGIHQWWTCNTLQQSATHCYTLQRFATHCNALQHTTALCNTLQHTTTHTHCNAL